MKPFTSAHRFNAAYRWLALHATGDCSVLVDVPGLGTLVYVYQSRVPLFRALYGPLPVGWQGMWSEVRGAGTYGEWLEHAANAQRFGSADPGAVADVLTYGKVTR